MGAPEKSKAYNTAFSVLITENGGCVDLINEAVSLLCLITTQIIEIYLKILTCRLVDTVL